MGKAIHSPYIEFGKRKDQQGRNTLCILKPYSGFISLIDNGYKNLNIHEKIAVRSGYCGVCYPTAMIDELLHYN